MITEFKIQVPEGMEIDRENSTFECIKFKSKDLTYQEISKKFQPYNYSVSTNAKNLSKLITFKKLLEVADYLNGDWKPEWNDVKQIKYFILYNEYNVNQKIYIEDCYYTNQGIVYFSSYENAEKAIKIIGEEELIQFYL